MSSLVMLKIYTPHGTFWNQKVSIVTVKTTEGYIGFQKNKSPFLASLDIAELHINEKLSKHYKICAIAGGLVIAERDHIKIITDAIEFKENIDLTRARHAKEMAERKLKATKSNAELLESQIALKKAINRIEIRNS